jgi:hypothetical protein
MLSIKLVSEVIERRSNFNIEALPAFLDRNTWDYDSVNQEVIHDKPFRVDPLHRLAIDAG